MNAKKLIPEKEAMNRNFPKWKNRTFYLIGIMKAYCQSKIMLRVKISGKKNPVWLDLAYFKIKDENKSKK